MDFPLPPRVLGRLLSSNPCVPFEDSGILDMLPPSIEILDSREHHQVLLHLLVVKVLKQKYCRTKLEFRETFRLPVRFKSEIVKELQRKLEVFARRNEGFQHVNTQWVPSRYLL